MVFNSKVWKNVDDPTLVEGVDPEVEADELNRVEQGIVDAHSHMANTLNPHGTTASQVGLGNVTNDLQLKASQLQTTITNDYIKVPSSGSVIDYVTGYAEPIIAVKNNAFNCSFGTAAGTVCVGNDGRLSNARTPLAHAHGNVTNTGYLGSTANIPLITGTAGIIQAGSFGSAANTYCQGNDSRLSDARTPVAHAHGNITNTGYLGSTASIPLITGTGGVIQAGSFGSTAGTFCQGNDGRLSDSRTPLSHVHGGISNTGAIGSTANLPIITGASGVLQVGSFGTLVNTFCQGNDARLSNDRNDANAVHVTGSGEVNGLTSKVSLAPTDLFIIEDSSSSYSKKKVAFSIFADTGIDGGSPSTVYTVAQLIDGGVA